MRHNNFWYIDLDSGARRQLTNFGREFTIRDFDVSADGREIVFDRRPRTPIWRSSSSGGADCSMRRVMLRRHVLCRRDSKSDEEGCSVETPLARCVRRLRRYLECWRRLDEPNTPSDTPATVMLSLWKSTASMSSPLRTQKGHADQSSIVGAIASTTLRQVKGCGERACRGCRANLEQARHRSQYVHRGASGASAADCGIAD